MFRIVDKNTSTEIEAFDRVLQMNENKASILTFKLIPNSNYFFKIKKWITRIEVWKDNKKYFDGRVIAKKRIMNSDGLSTLQVICESVLNFLNDSNVGKWEIHPDSYISSEEDTEEIIDPFEIYTNITVVEFLKMILDKHNSTVLEDKRIYLGDVTVNDTVYCYTNRENSLNVIQDKLIDKKGGFLQIREVDNKYYLDYLKEVEQEEGIIELGVNLESFTDEDDKEIYTRVTPIGSDGLSIKEINNGLDYVEDNELVAQYGVINKVITFEDVTLPENLLKKAKEKFEDVKKIDNNLDVKVLDISYISANFKEFRLSQYCKIVNPIFKIDDVKRIVALTIYLDDVTSNTISFSSTGSSYISRTNSIIQEFQNTKLEMAIIDDKLVSKITKGQATSLIEQASDEILVRVEEGEQQLSSQIKINATAIEQRVKSSELESIVTQNAESWNLSINGKLSGKTYTFDGDGFTLGSTSNGNTAVHTNEYSRWKHKTDGYSEANSQGFFRNGRPYHSLIEIGNTITGGSAGVYPKTVTIQLSDEFKGKSFKVIVSVVDFSGSGEDIEYLKRLHLNVDSYDYTNARFTVTGYWTSIRDNAGVITENEKELRWSYVAIGG